MEKTYIIDFQGFKDLQNRFIMKELAIISCNMNKIVHCIIKPPYPFKVLFSERKKQIMRLKNNYHGLDWEDGFITKKAAMALFRETVKDGENLLIKGKERCKFIQHLFPTKTVIDLEDLECPPAKRIPELSNAPQCFHYNHIQKNNTWKEYTCSLNNVYKFKVWCEFIHLKITNNIPSFVPTSQLMSQLSLSLSTPLPQKEQLPEGEELTRMKENEENWEFDELDECGEWNEWEKVES